MKVLLAVLLLSLTACIPTNPIMKNVSISVTAGSAVYSLDEYCNSFTQTDRLALRQQINMMSLNRAEVTCAGDTE